MLFRFSEAIVVLPELDRVTPWLFQLRVFGARRMGLLFV